jgi:hypothetical protein
MNYPVSPILRKVRQLIKLTDFLFKITFSSPFSMILLLGTWIFNLMLPVVQIFNFEYEKNVSVNCAITTIFTVSIFFIWNMLYHTYGKTKRSGSSKLIEIRPVSKQWLYIAHLTGYTFILGLFLLPLALTPTLAERISEHLITDQGAPYYFKDLPTALIFSLIPLLTFGITMLFRKGIIFFVISFNFISIIAFVIAAIILKDSFKLNLLVSSALIALLIFTLLVLSASVKLIYKHKSFQLIPIIILLLGFFFYPLLSQFAIFRILVPPYGHALNLAITSPGINEAMPYILYSLAYSLGVIAICLLVTAMPHRIK